MSKIDLTQQVQGILPVVNGGTGNSGTQSPTFFDSELPAGTQNGVNLTFTLASVPFPALSLILVKNNAVQIQGTDYTLSGNTITYTAAPAGVDVIRAWYRAIASLFEFVDLLLIQDTIVVGRGLPLSSTLTLSDALVKKLIVVQTEALSDTLTIADSFLFIMDPTLVQVADQLAVLDLVQIGRGLQVKDTVTLTDALRVGRGVALSDTLALTDSFAKTLA